MTNFLVLFKTGPSDADYEVCAVVQDKKADEGEVAIEEAMTRGPGEYMAVSLNTAVRRQATTAFKLTDPDEDESG